MTAMTFVCLGVLVLSIYLPTQVDSDNSATTPLSANLGNSTNVTAVFPTPTLSTNTTITKGAGNALQSSLSPFLIPLVASASVLRLCC